MVPRLKLPRNETSIVGVRREKTTITRTIGMVQRSGRSLSPAAAAFARLLTQALRATAKPMRANQPAGAHNSPSVVPSEARNPHCAAPRFLAAGSE